MCRFACRGLRQDAQVTRKQMSNRRLECCFGPDFDAPDNFFLGRELTDEQAACWRLTNLYSLDDRHPALSTSYYTICSPTATA
jgi:hypothetical protein